MPDDDIGIIACGMGALFEPGDYQYLYLQFSVQSFLLFSGDGAE